MLNFSLGRRALLSSGIASIALMIGAKKSKAEDGLKSSPDFQFEVTRTEDEWRAMLTEEEYTILREGGTEKPKSSPLWEETREGTYHCKGCDLEVYTSEWKDVLDKGWVFFRHASNSAVMTAIDGYGIRYQDGEDFARLSKIETHCRRCGSHLGHIFFVEKAIRHCINGASLVFKPTAA